jgi:transposase
LKKAYRYREELSALFDEELPKEEGKKKIKNGRKRVKASGLKCFDNFFKTLSNWMDEITNYFVDRNNSGFVEGLNNKIKVLKRRCYGIFNLRHLSSESTLIWKVIAALLELFADTTTYRFFHGKYQRATF